MIAWEEGRRIIGIDKNVSETAVSRSFGSCGSFTGALFISLALPMCLFSFFWYSDSNLLGIETLFGVSMEDLAQRDWLSSVLQAIKQWRQLNPEELSFDNLETVTTLILSCQIFDSGWAIDLKHICQYIYINRNIFYVYLGFCLCESYRNCIRTIATDLLHPAYNTWSSWKPLPNKHSPTSPWLSGTAAGNFEVNQASGSPCFTHFAFSERFRA